jgi:M6 family metalloprotease-like protein
MARIAVIAHECAHFLGLPDLYDTTGGAGVGTFDLLGKRHTQYEIAKMASILQTSANKHFSSTPQVTCGDGTEINYTHHSCLHGPRCNLVG